MRRLADGARLEVGDRMGRPTIYTDEQADSVMENMVEHALTPSEAIAQAGVNQKTWYKWLLENEALRKRWDACMENLSDRYADEAQHITKSRKGDTTWAKIYIDVLKWHLRQAQPAPVWC
jgi:hypothetical protein